MDGLFLVVVMGDGKWVVPVDCAVRRPHPVSAGAPGRDKLSWARTMMDERLAAWRHRGLARPPPIITADRWLSDAKWMAQGRTQHQGTLLVEGKVSSAFPLANGQHVTGHDLIESESWPWRDHPWEPRVRSVRLQAKSPTYGAVTVVMVDEPGPDRVSLRCLETTLSGPVLIRRWRRRT